MNSREALALILARDMFYHETGFLTERERKKAFEVLGGKAMALKMAERTYEKYHPSMNPPGEKVAVVRDCCHAGHCLECWSMPRMAMSPPERRKPVCQGHWAPGTAKDIMKNWAELNARIEPIDRCPCARKEVPA